VTVTFFSTRPESCCADTIPLTHRKNRGMITFRIGTLINENIQSDQQKKTFYG